MNPPRSRRAPQVPGGFTFVELVTVMVLMGILAVAAFSRLGSGDAFEESGVEAITLAQARLAQQTAMTRTDAAVVLLINRVGGRLVYDIQADGSSLGSLDVEAASTSLSVSAGAANGAVTGGNALQLGFDALGDVITVQLGGTAGSAGSGVALSVSGTGGGNLCISPVGFAHRGSCV